MHRKWPVEKYEQNNELILIRTVYAVYIINSFCICYFLQCKFFVLYTVTHMLFYPILSIYRGFLKTHIDISDISIFRYDISIF